MSESASRRFISTNVDAPSSEMALEWGEMARKTAFRIFYKTTQDLETQIEQMRLLVTRRGLGCSLEA